jgi:hypothetical protein
VSDKKGRRFPMAGQAPDSLLDACRELLNALKEGSPHEAAQLNLWREWSRAGGPECAVRLGRVRW